MAGQLIDQQMGWGLSMASLDGEETGTFTGELLFWMGTCCCSSLADICC